MLIKNPLNEQAVLDIDILGLQRYGGETKVRGVFDVAELLALLMITSDKMGAFDQPHLTEDGLPAHYPGKGIIITEFCRWFSAMAGEMMPTDYIPIENASIMISSLPEEYVLRASLHLKAEKRIPIEFIIRSSCEGSMAEKAKQGKTICGQELPRDLQLGDILSRPYFTPTTKAPKGEKDKPITLEEYYGIIGDKYLANYLYGMAVLLHLRNRAEAMKKGLDRPDQKLEFALFTPGLPIHVPIKNNLVGWNVKQAENIFNITFMSAGMEYESWKLMPKFDITLFSEYSGQNAIGGMARLIDEAGGTDDGRLRLLSDTMMGRRLVQSGNVDLGKVFIENYLCKEFFRLASKKTGKGGYEKSASQEVIISDAVLAETGRRNLRALLMLTS